MISLLTKSYKIDLTHTKMVRNDADADRAGMGLVRGLELNLNLFWTQRWQLKDDADRALHGFYNTLETKTDLMPTLILGFRN